MEYYTYILIDPRNNKIFYVGKGQKRRMYKHVNDVQRGRIPNRSNTKLGNKIKKILDSGNKVKYKKVLIIENGQEAFNKEKELIKEIGLENLCNLTEGGEGHKYWLGKPRSEETKRKMSESHKGQISWWRGKKLSEKHKRKISENHSRCRLGKKHSEETKKKMSENHSRCHLGKKHSEETKKRISEANKGENHPFYGKKHSEESKRKMSKSKRKVDAKI